MLFYNQSHSPYINRWILPDPESFPGFLESRGYHLDSFTKGSEKPNYLDGFILYRMEINSHARVCVCLCHRRHTIHFHLSIYLILIFQFQTNYLRVKIWSAAHITLQTATRSTNEKSPTEISNASYVSFVYITSAIKRRRSYTILDGSQLIYDKINVCRLE